MASPRWITWSCRCGRKYSVSAADPNIDNIPIAFKCWNAAVSCRYYLKKQSRCSISPIVTADQLFRAIAGLGVDNETKCSPAVLRKLIIGKKVTKLSIEKSPDKNRSLVSSLTLEGGITVHLATSTKGVTVYKVTNE